MNILTIKNNNLTGFNIYDFLKYYKEDIGYAIDKNEEGYLFIYEQFFPCQVFDIMRNNKKAEDFLDEKIENLYFLSIDKLHLTKKIYFFYTFTFYSKYDFDFDILKTIKEKIKNKFNKDIVFVLNNHFEDDDYLHFNSYRYDIYNDARKIKKIKNLEKKEKIFISLNAKERHHRDDLYEFLKNNNLLNNFFFSYTERNIHLWKTNTLLDFADKYFANEEQSGHKAFEFYINDDLFNTKHGDFFDKSYYYIVTETSAHDELCFMGEKTYKAFYHKIPFLIIGNPYSLKNLKKEGFKTFDKWIDESYDNEKDYEKRKIKIFNEIKRLNNLSINEHEKNLTEMSEILEYNSHHFLETKNIKNDFFKLIS